MDPYAENWSQLVADGEIATAGQAAADAGQEEYDALCQVEGVGGGRVGTGRAAKRAATKQLAENAAKRRKARPSEVRIHCQLFLTKEALVAKKSGDKKYEGRWGPQAWRRKKGDIIQYFYPVTNWQIDSEPTRWITIRNALAVLGWRTLMPWALSEEDVRYCALFAKADLTVETAREWEWKRLNVSDRQPFMTWHDHQIRLPPQAAATSKPVASPRKAKGQEWGEELAI